MRRLTLLPLLLSLLSPAAASAFTSTITFPAAGTRLVFDHASPPTVHLAGTADSNPVDLRCVTTQAGSSGISAVPIASSVTVTGGTFSTDAVWPAGADLCDVYAVPAGTTLVTKNDVNGLSGALVYSAISLPRFTGGRLYDFDVDMASPKSYDKMESFGDYPMEYQEPIDNHEYGPLVLDAGAAIFDSDRTAATPTPSLRIDGRPAYPTAYIGSGSLGSLAGWTGLTFAVSDDGGAFDVTSHEGTFHCAGGTAPDAFPPSAASCGGFVGTGVDVATDERTSADGGTVVQNFTLTSNDHQSHTVAAVLNDETEVARDWFFPGTAGFQSYGIGAVSPVPDGPATIRNRVTGDPSQDFGAITYVRQPLDDIFFHAGDTFAQHYGPITIPPDRSARFEFIYSVDTTSAGLDTLVAANEASIGAPPAIAVTSAPSVNAAAYTLTGTINAPEALNALAVNGQPAPIGSGTGFSVPETLTTGANAFTVAATDELGRTTTTPFTVTLSGSPPPASKPLPVRFRKSGKPKVNGRTLTTGLAAVCSGPGPACSISVRATLGRTLAGKRSAKVRAGRTAAIKIKLSRRAAARLKHTHKLKLTLKLSGKRSGAATTTAKRTLKLSRRR